MEKTYTFTHTMKSGASSVVKALEGTSSIDLKPGGLSELPVRAFLFRVKGTHVVAMSRASVRAALDDHCRITIRVNVDESFLTEAQAKELDRRIPERIKRHLDRTELRAREIAAQTEAASL